MRASHRRGQGQGQNQGQGQDNAPHSAAHAINMEVPFRDSEPGDGEMPLDELDTFRIPARDNNGASDHMTIYAPPLLMRYTDIVVHTHRFPYLNRGDLVRHAVARHLVWLTSIRGSLPRHLASGMEAMSEVCRDDDMQINAQSVLARIKERIDRYLNTSETGEAIILINRLRTILEGVQDSHWTRAFKLQFYRQYGRHLTAGKAAAAADGDGGEGEIEN